MLARDHLGYVHNIPDYPVYRPQRVLYDGLGNPVGFAFLAPLLEALGPALTSALPSIASAVIPAIGGLFGGKKEEPAAAPPPAPVPAFVAPPPEAAPCPPCEPCPVCPVCGAPVVESPALPAPIALPTAAGPRFFRIRRRRRVHAHPR
jgi:hypothetical protein